jgi:hypothetical protein
MRGKVVEIVILGLVIQDKHKFYDRWVDYNNQFCVLYFCSDTYIDIDFDHLVHYNQNHEFDGQYLRCHASLKNNRSFTLI